jgi:amino acid permease
VTLLFFFVFMLPLSLAKEINTLRYASCFGMLSTGILVAAIVAHAAQDNPGMQNLQAASWTFDMVRTLPIFSFAYCCQTNAFEVYHELRNRSVRRMTTTTAISMAACTIIYTAAGIAGHADFGEDVNDDILLNYGVPTSTGYIAVAVVAISFTLTMAFPICLFPSRDAVLQLLGYADVYHTPGTVRIVVCVALALVSAVIGLFVPRLELLFGLLGGSVGSALGYVLPVMLAWRAGGWTVAEVGVGHVAASWALLVGGALCGVGGTVSTLVAAV